MTARLLGTACVASALLLSLVPAQAKVAHGKLALAQGKLAPAKPRRGESVRRADRARVLPAHRAERERVLAPLETAATACFAETIDANPTALAHAQAGRWYEAASVGGYLCRPEVAKLMRAHDVFDGAGAGARYFRGPYVRRLGTALAAKLEPALVTRHAVADALPPAETVKANATDADTVSAGLAQP